MEGTTTTVLVPLPEAGNDKLKKLGKVVNKRMAEQCKAAALDTPARVEVAADAEGNGLCFGYMVHDDEKEAQTLVREIPHVKLDRNHSFHLVPLPEVEAFNPDEIPSDEQALRTLEETHPLINPESLKVTDRKEMWQWFVSSGDEMFMLRHGDATEVYQFDGATFEPKLVNDGAAARAEHQKKAKLANAMAESSGQRTVPWTLAKAFWSPQGSYITTTHIKGVRLWGGDDFHSITRLTHSNVQVGIYSKNEEYVVTWDREHGEAKIFVHSVLTSKCLAKLNTPHKSPHGTTQWPFVCWSHDSKFLALRHPQGIQIYSVPAMTKVLYTAQGESFTYLPFKNALFSWQPNSDMHALPLMAIWMSSNQAAAPSRLTILQIPTMRVMATRNIYSVDGLARTFWQNHGTHCALVTQVQNKVIGRKKVTLTQLDVFTMEPNAAGTFDSSCMAIDHDVISVVWSDAKNRLAVLLANKQVMFFAVTQKGLEQCGAPLDITVDINTIAWSPLGTHFVLAACDSDDTTGNIWFGLCTDEPHELYSVSIVHKDEKPKLRHVDWDPSGRYVATSVSTPQGSDQSYKTEGARGYTIWSCQGKAVYSAAIEKLHRFQWRPHPLVHISQADSDLVKQNMSVYSKKFDAEDTQRKNVRRQELAQKRKIQEAEFKESIQRAHDEYMALPGVQEWIAAEQSLAH